MSELSFGSLKEAVELIEEQLNLVLSQARFATIVEVNVDQITQLMGIANNSTQKLESLEARIESACGPE